jgi:hypothetical protein
VHDWGCLTWTKIFSKTRKARMRFTGLCNHIQIAGALQPDLDRPLFCSSILSYLLPPILFSPLLFRSSAEEEEMTGFLVIALLLCLLKDGAYKATAWDDADFFSNCPQSRCSNTRPRHGMMRTSQRWSIHQESGTHSASNPAIPPHYAEHHA